MRIVVTGARGRIGRTVIPYLEARHEVVGIDVRAPRRSPVLRADLSRRPGRLARALGRGRSRWQRSFDGADAVLHLAAVVNPASTWPQVLESNIKATWNVLEAASEHRIPRVVFASSLWSVMGILEQRGRDGLPEDPQVLNPVGAYGMSKGVGEMAGRMFVKTGRLRTFVAVRIGIFHRKTPKSDPFGVHVRPDELNELLRDSLEGDLGGFHLRYAIGASSATDSCSPESPATPSSSPSRSVAGSVAAPSASSTSPAEGEGASAGRPLPKTLIS